MSSTKCPTVTGKAKRDRSKTDCHESQETERGRGEFDDSRGVGVPSGLFVPLITEGRGRIGSW